MVVVAIVMALLATVTATAQQTQTATFAGGCFWCMEKPFDVLDGVVSTTSGYAGGHVENPTYDQVTRGGTGHAEVVQVEYDPSRISYEELLYVYWRNVDPVDGGGQFCDRGASYRPAIFTESDEQEALAEQSHKEIEETLGRSVAVDIRPLNAFYPAEDYHQNYYMTNPVRYRLYRSACGRDRRLENVWGMEAGGENPGMWLGSMNDE